jgi:hypothetical protein
MTLAEKFLVFWVFAIVVLRFAVSHFAAHFAAAFADCIAMVLPMLLL